uniref:LEA protein n=1 Tax=Juglans regia TaxID=51240 RepID=M9WNT1_JUGRE|nr:LEA protein [Juglans regia]
MALFQNKYGAAQTDAYDNVTSTDEYGNAIRRDENGNIMAGTDEYGKVIRTDESGYVIPTDDYGNPIRHSGSTFQGMQRQQQQRQRHDPSTEYDGQGRGRRNMAGEAAHSTDAYGNVIRTDEYGNVSPTDEYGNRIRHSGTTHQGVHQQRRHDLSTEYDGQGRGRRNMAGQAANSTDAYGNVIRTDEYGNVSPTDEYGNRIRHSGTTLQGVHQQRRHDHSTEYDGHGGGRNKAGEAYSTDAYGNVIRTDEHGNVPAYDYGNPIRIPGVGHRDHRSDTSYATATTYPTTASYGTGGQLQHRHHKGVMEKIKDKLSGTSYDQHDEYY